MKRRMISVDYEWAYQEVVGSNDFYEKSDSWVKSFVEGWREGFLDGYIQGRIESAIKIICLMKRDGFTSVKIAEMVNVSSDIIDMIGKVNTVEE